MMQHAPASDRSRYVQYGSWATGPASWRNFDASPTLRLQRLPGVGRVVRRLTPSHRPLFEPTVEYGDIVAGLPIPERSCRAIYCSHVLEHLSREDCRAALRNTYRYLEPGGRFRLVMPDLRSLAEAYLRLDNEDAAHLFMQRAYLGEIRRDRRFRGHVVRWLGNAAHLWMWDFDSMNHELKELGFERIRRAAYGDSEEPRFVEVEDPERWVEAGLDGTGTITCLGIECQRPVSG